MITVRTTTGTTYEFKLEGAWIGRRWSQMRQLKSPVHEWTPVMFSTPIESGKKLHVVFSGSFAGTTSRVVQVDWSDATALEAAKLIASYWRWRRHHVGLTQTQET